MIEETVNSILEAEDEAKRRIAQAEANAGEIVAKAEAQADAYKKREAQSNKANYADAVKQAESVAESKAETRLAELNSQTDKEAAAYAQNIDKAVKIIIGAK